MNIQPEEKNNSEQKASYVQQVAAHALFYVITRYSSKKIIFDL
jgi:hypothetical protein